jgi:hypothetical protein
MAASLSASSDEEAIDGPVVMHKPTADYSLRSVVLPVDPKEKPAGVWQQP